MQPLTADYTIKSLQNSLPTRLSMLFSPKLPAMEIMLKMKILNNRNVIAEHLKKAKQC